jgi:tRNA(Ile)-lysidine synthase
MLEDILKNQCGLDHDRLLVVGVSGGPDSLTLLHLLQMAGYPLLVAHFNHRLRPEAEAEAAAVESLAQQMGLPFAGESDDVTSYAEKEGLSIEEAARTLRYRFLFGQAQRHEGQAVAVGHTADDQVETVLMHLIRGAGLSGLKGMAYRTILPTFDPGIPVVRPLLGLWRVATESYCREHGLSPHHDPSNADPIYLRNRLRHELLPELQRYNPQVKQALWRTAFALQGDFGLLAEMLDDAWRKSVCEEGDSYVGFERKVLTAFSLALRRNLFRRAASMLRPGLRDADFDVLGRAASLEPGDLVGGLRLIVEGQRVYLAGWEADLPSAQWPQVGSTVVCEIGGTVDLGEGWSLSSEVLEGETLLAEAAGNADPYRAWLDWEQVWATTVGGEMKLTVRAAPPGERFQPLGMDGHSIKLSDFFVNIKLPRRARRSWPVVYARDVPVWVVGYRLAHPFRVRADTKRAICLKVLHQFR